MATASTFSHLPNQPTGLEAFLSYQLRRTGGGRSCALECHHVVSAPCHPTGTYRGTQMGLAPEGSNFWLPTQNDLTSLAPLTKNSLHFGTSITKSCTSLPPANSPSKFRQPPDYESASPCRRRPRPRRSASRPGRSPPPRTRPGSGIPPTMRASPSR